MYKSLLALLSCTVLIMADNVTKPLEPQVDIHEDNSKSILSNTFYAGIGYTHVRYDEETTGHSNKGYSLQVGYDYSPYISIEARYTNSSADSEKKYTFSGDLKNTAIYLKPTLPLTEDVSAYGLLGYGQTSIDTQAGEKSESDFQLGLGVKYDFMQNLNLFVDYTRFHEGNGFDRDSSESDITLYSINTGLNYVY